jgi:hypothetical protein
LGSFLGSFWVGVVVQSRYAILGQTGGRQSHKMRAYMGKIWVFVMKLKIRAFLPQNELKMRHQLSPD